MAPSGALRLGLRLRACVLALAVCSCSGAGAGAGTGRGGSHGVPAGAPDFANRIDDAATWRLLAARPDDETIAHTEVVKFLLDVANGRRSYFTQSNRWPIHYDFARRFLDTSAHPIEDHEAFNVRQYRRDDRRFVLGSIVHYLDADVWAVEIIAGDTIGAPMFLAAFEDLRARTFFGRRLRFHPIADHHEQLAARLGDRVPVVTTAALYGAVRYQPVTLGVAFGYVRIVRGELDAASVRRNEIIVVDSVPDDLPLCAAFVTSRLQAPLAHVAVLSQNRHTPNMALRDAVTSPDLLAREGTLVRLEVGPQDFALTAATQAEAAAAWRAERPSRQLLPELDTRRSALADVCTLDGDDIAFAGAKAAQLGAACGVQGVRTPGGFVVPIHHYLAHLGRNGIATRVSAMLRDPLFVATLGARSQALEALRTQIASVPVDRALVREVLARVALFPPGKVIFRSSTNAEDLPGFNGAGLYDSVVVEPPVDEAAVTRALGRVWASVWTLRGFEERDWYRVDHEHVAMAVLVQPFVADIAARGVAITANPFYDGRPAVFINLQSSAGSVTAAGNDVPEQHLVYVYSAELEDEIVSRSSLTHGAPVVPPADILALARVLARMHDVLVPRYRSGVNAVDVEFLVTRHHEIVIVQARPYTVVYSGGRRAVYAD